MTDNLKKEKEYNEIINSYKNMELYDAYYATSIYKGMLDNFNIYMEPAYKEEIFVNDHLGLQEDTESENSIYIDNTDRKESKLEKIYGSLVLAVGLESEYNYSIDFDKLYKILLLSYTPKESLNKLLGGQKLVDMVKEQEELTSLEGEYASLISILQDDLQIKSYEDNDMIDGYKNETKGLKLFEHYYLYHRPYFNNRIPCLGKVLGEASEHTFTKEEVIVPGRRVIPVLRKK